MVVRRQNRVTQIVDVGRPGGRRRWRVHVDVDVEVQRGLLPRGSRRVRRRRRQAFHSRANEARVRGGVEQASNKQASKQARVAQVVSWTDGRSNGTDGTDGRTNRRLSKQTQAR